ncbi:putative membrane protein [Mycobacteroides chelonae]|nr:putative membrane protein [Mycobacteroides chelonae]
MTTPELPRPRIVDVAFWFWVVAAAALFLNGLAGVLTGFDMARAAKPSFTDDQVRDLVTFSRGWGALCILLAAGIAFLAGRTRQGDTRYRRALITLSVVSVLGAIALATSGSVGPVLLIAALSLIVANVLIIRPTAQNWFAGGEHG